MKLRACCIALSFLSVLVCTGLAQTAAPNSSLASTQVPRLIRFSGVAQDETHNPMTGVVGITFSLYKDQQGGSPLWVETQNVQADAGGHYTALLGSASAEGVPMELFSSGEAQWLGVQIQGQPEHARVLLVSVPYALKAHEAETLSGRSITDFVLLNKTASSSPTTSNTAAGPSGASGSSLPAVNNDDPTNFAGANATQIVGVTQKGTGLGLSATARTLAAVAGTITGKSNTAVYGLASNTSKGSNAAGVTGQANTETGPGVAGYSSSPQGTGVVGVANATSGSANGVFGQTASPGGTGVLGINNATSGFAIGVQGESASTAQYAVAVFGNETAATGEVFGVEGHASSTGPNASAVTGFELATTGLVSGVSGGTNSTTNFAAGVVGFEGATTGQVYGVLGKSASTSGGGVFGSATAASGNTSGVFGQSSSPNGNGVLGINNSTTGFSPGVMGVTNSGTSAGIYGYNATTSGYGSAVQGQIEASPGGAAGVFVAHGGVGLILNGLSGSNFAQMFSVDASGNGFYAGNLTVTGKLTKGSGSFKIDHPLDPANKYLSHSFVESPDMMNIYNGVVVLDAKGEASVNLPEYFQALNSDFRYQLTPIGAPGPNLYIAEEISGNHFKVAGGKPGAKVSWQVTGVRQDAYAKAHRIKVEEDKPAQERGHYLHPELFGATEKEAIGSNVAPAMTVPVTTAKTNVGNLR
ncbi:MAG: hypothetical protein WA239_23110 [Candidatus Sulfotelmatobacter sp.]|jgi:trimeric autotransporter adhesin